MNSILGIGLKTIKVEKGLEHDKITAKVVMDEKIIGDILNDGWCDEFYIEFKTLKYKNEFEERMNKYLKRKKIKSCTYDFFIKELLFINQEYKSTKNAQLKCQQLTYFWS